MPCACPLEKGITGRVFAGSGAPNATFLEQRPVLVLGELATPLCLRLQVPRTPSQPLAGSESRRFTNKHSKKALKASLTLGILLGMFFVAWLPFFVTNVAQVRACGGFMSCFQKLFL